MLLGAIGSRFGDAINRDCKTGGGYIGLVLTLPRLRDGCSMTQGVVFTGSFFASICLAPARIKEDLKAVGKLVDLLEDVFTNQWKEDAVFTSLSTGIEATSEVSDDLLQAKSKGKQAANDFAVSRCSSHLKWESHFRFL